VTHAMSQSAHVHCAESQRSDQHADARKGGRWPRDLQAYLRLGEVVQCCIIGLSRQRRRLVQA
jgi:hypothetical protein